MLLAGQTPLANARRLVGLKVPQLTEQLSSTTFRQDSFYQLGGDHTCELPNCYSGQKLIFMIRDARDTVASMLALPRWLEMYSWPVLRYKMLHEEYFSDTYAHEISLLHKSPFPRVAAAALIWRYKVDALFDYLNKGYPLLPVWYETLVSSPTVEMIRVCAFLQIPWEEAVLHHSRMSHSELAPDGRAIGNTDPSRSIDSTSVGQWKSYLEDGHLAEIVKITGSLQGKLYPQAGDTVARG
jgi:hypothetical protein